MCWLVSKRQFGQTARAANSQSLYCRSSSFFCFPHRGHHRFCSSPLTLLLHAFIFALVPQASRLSQLTQQLKNSSASSPALHCNYTPHTASQFMLTVRPGLHQLEQLTFLLPSKQCGSISIRSVPDTHTLSCSL